MIKTFLEKFRTILWSLGQVFQANPKDCIFLGFLLVLQGILPALGLLVLQKVIDWVVYPDQSLRFPFMYIGIWGTILLLETIGQPALALSRLRLNEKVLAHCNLLLMEKANAFEGLEFIESPQFYSNIQLLKEEAKKKPLNFVYVIASFLQETIAIISVLLLLAHLKWWVPFFIFLSAIPHAISTVWFEKQSWDLALFKSPEMRKMAWLSSLTLEEKAAKEIRLFGFGDFLITRYRELAKSFQKTMNYKRAKQSIWLISLSTLTVIGHFLIFIWTILYAKRGLLSGGALVMGLQGLVLTQREMGLFMQNLGMVTQPLLFFSKLKQFLRHPTPIQANRISFTNLNESIVFENVSFTYPDGRRVLNNVNLSIQRGEKIAFVGENGAGKSTVIKLLLRFYDPTAGRILVDGIDLSSLEVGSWRKKISGIFQDFNQYHLTIGENIGIANVGLLLEEDAIKKAAYQGGFSSIAESLPEKYHTLLGKEFGGTSLSGGEWQKLAMSRAFMKEADLLILDEPTASLDPKSEREVFRKFADVSTGKTTIFITHRLHSIFMTDRVIVFKEGAVIEEGYHQDLIYADGEYALLYSMQADCYLEGKK